LSQPLFANAADFFLANRDSDAPALFHRSEIYSHRELARRVDQTAAYLLESLIRPGDVVAIVADNSIQWVVWYLAVLRSGAVAMPLPGSESSRALHSALHKLQLRLVLCQQKYAEKIAELVRDRPDVPLITETETIPANLAPPAQWPVLEPRQTPALLLLTSGSTGDPKCVRLSHANLQANAQSILAYLNLLPDDRMMVVLPFNYCYGLSLLHTHLHMGASLVLNNQFMFPSKMLDELAARACTGFAGVPSTYQILLRKTDLARRQFPHLRHVQQAGGRLAVPLILELRQALPSHTRIFIMYGATEATSRLTYLPPERLEDKLGSIGLPIPSVQVQICDETGRELLAGQTGELVASGPNIALGYDENETSERLRDGKLFTGDLGYVDGDGFLWLVSRQADFIKSFGFRISPREIEDVIAALPHVLEVAVTGIKDEEAGEALAAFVVPVPGQQVTAEAIKEHCLAHLPNHKVPQVVAIRSELPKNEAGKVQRSRISLNERQS
jgi:acyl-CoA synthetase (AMP-forming)/AMP-acid ligase II